MQERAETDVRLSQLVAELFTRPFCKEPLEAAGLGGDRAAAAICASVQRRLAEMRQANVQRQNIGRLVYTGVIAVCLDHAVIEYGGTRQELANALGISRQATYLAQQRRDKAKQLGLICLLDPRRNERKDKCNIETVEVVQTFWTASTKAAPDKNPFVKVELEDGTTVCHGIHWQQKSTREIFLRYCENPPLGGATVRTVGLTTFTALRPYFVRRVGFRGCLCGKL